jgi:hypothetical protein
MPQPKPFALIIPQYKASGLGAPDFDYTKFVSDTFDTNRKQRKHVKRPEVDRMWAQMLPKWMPHDPSRCRGLLAEVKAPPFLL